MNYRRGAALFLVALSLLLGLIPAIAQEPIEINFWHAFPEEHRIKWINETVDKFNSLFPQYKVTATSYPSYEDLFTAVALAHEQGTAPAIVHYFEAASTDARNSGYYKSIADVLGDRTEVNGVPVNMDDFVPAVVNYYTLDGKFNSMPWNTSSAIMFSNKGMLDAAGVTKIPETWAEVEEACAKIMAMPDAPAHCITWPNHGWFFEQSLAQQNADLANNGNGREATATEVMVNSDAAVAYVSWWLDMANKGYYIYTGKQRDWDGANAAFLSKQVAMEITSSSDVTFLTDSGTENDIEVVTSHMPYNQETGWTGNLIGGASLWLTAGLPAEVEEGAVTFLLWFTNTENAASWHKATGYVPVRLSAVELLEKEGWYEANPNQLAAADQLAKSQSTSATRGALVGNLPLIRNAVTQAIENLLVNGGDVKAALDKANEEANKILADYNALYGD